MYHSLQCDRPSMVGHIFLGTVHLVSLHFGVALSAHWAMDYIFLHLKLPLWKIYCYLMLNLSMYPLPVILTYSISSLPIVVIGSLYNFLNLIFECMLPFNLVHVFVKINKHLYVYCLSPGYFLFVCYTTGFPLVLLSEFFTNVKVKGFYFASRVLELWDLFIVISGKCERDKSRIHVHCMTGNNR